VLGTVASTLIDSCHLHSTRNERALKTNGYSSLVNRTDRTENSEKGSFRKIKVVNRLSMGCKAQLAAQLYKHFFDL